jgi:hypothetical protein
VELVGPYERMVGKHPPVFEVYMTRNTPTKRFTAPDSAFRSRVGLAISTAAGYAQPGIISPKGIALGRSDRFFVTLNRNLAHSGRVVYVRLMGEMNGDLERLRRLQRQRLVPRPAELAPLLHRGLSPERADPPRWASRPGRPPPAGARPAAAQDRPTRSGEAATS